jgi:hypothetical protein
MKINSHLYIFLASVLIFTACNKEFEYQKLPPSLNFIGGIAKKAGVTTGSVRIKLNLQAIDELATLKVSKSRNGEAFVALPDITEFSNAFRENELVYLYEIPVRDPTAQIGDKIKVQFQLFDKNGNSSSTLTFEIEVTGALFVRTPETINGQDVITISAPAGATIATINEDEFTFEGDKKYILDGIVQVEEGLKVIFEAGTQVYGRTGNPAKLAAFYVPVEGIAEFLGTKDAPVLMTSDKVLKGETPLPGDWQGIEVNGSANGAVNTNQSSGIFRYLRVEYGGRRADIIGETQAQIKFNGVGAGTTIEFVQSFFCEEIGIRFDGGTARAKYLISTNAKSHSYRLDDITGTSNFFQGAGQFWIAVNANDVDGEDLRIDDNAAPTLSNITLIGPGNTSAKRNSACRIRNDAGNYKIYNAVFAQFPNTGFRAENTAPTGVAGERVLRNSYLFDITGDLFRNNAGNYAQAEYANVLNTAITGIAFNAFVPTAEQVSTFNPATANAWFTAATFVGAVRNSANDWTADGSWCKNADGSIR